MKTFTIAAAVAAGLALSSGTASADNWLWGAGPADYCTARSAQVYELPVGAGAALASSRDARDPQGRYNAMMRVESDPVLKSTIDSQRVPIAAVVDVQFYRDCSAVIFTAY